MWPLAYLVQVTSVCWGTPLYMPATLSVRVKFNLGSYLGLHLSMGKQRQLSGSVPILRECGVLYDVPVKIATP